MIALSTLRLLESADQACYRRHLRYTMPRCEDAYSEHEGPRGHLGASLIGRDCSREIWYSFRWATIHGHYEGFSSRMLRLFNRGHLEEGRFVALLMAAGIQVWQRDDKGEQFRFTAHSGHFAGSIDAVVRGLPEFPTENILGEFKTHNKKSFEQLSVEMVRSTKIEHYVQMMIYAGAFQLPHTFYLAVNKNDDDLHAEILPYDAEIREQYMDRAGKIIFAMEPPPRVSSTPSWWKCKFCTYAQVCHYGVPLAVSCRTCQYVEPQRTGNASWLCRKKAKGNLTIEEQLAGCSDYLAIRGGA